jgi:hypothetical protein
MLKGLFLLLLVTSAAYGEKVTMDGKRKKIVAIVDEELGEVSRLARQQDFKSPDTLLRVAELNLEKARLWREAENEKYLSISPDERSRVNKTDYFKQSAKYFDDANDSALLVAKKFPNYKLIGEVYYILAFNSRELGKTEEAQRYFKAAASKAPEGSKVSDRSKIALADYYFNAHKYREAIPLYELGLRTVDEKWWTKDAFNLAWCYYRNKNYDKAISTMLEVHRKSASDKYIDMKSLVERDIGVFYVDSGRMKDAIKFYEANGINYTQQFIKVANAIVTQGRFSQAESLLQEAAKVEKDRNLKIEIYMAQLELFDKFNKVDEHLKTSQQLVAMNQESPLDEEALKRLSYQVNKKAAELQKATASGTYSSVAKVRNQKSQQAIAYFELSSLLSPSEKAEKTFFQAETAYAATSFGKALSLYMKSFDEAKKDGNKKILSQSLDGMLASLAQPELDSKIAEKAYVPVYTRYLEADSKSAKANTIFVKLFNTQYDAGQITEAEKTMENFSTHFPKDYKTQEAMLAKIMEYYRGKKNYVKVKEYVNDINSGKFKVSEKYAEALRGLMTKIQIEGVQESLERGEKGTALKGYHQIYTNADSTPKARVNAAYNLSALYYDLGDTEQSYNWGLVALKDMDASEVVKLGDSFLSIAGGLFLRQQFTSSSDFSFKVLEKICHQNSPNKPIAYKNAVYIALANNELDHAIEIRNYGKGCEIADATLTEVTIEILKDMVRAKKWDNYDNLLAELEKNPKNHALLIKPYEEYRKELMTIGDASGAKEAEAKQLRFYESAKKQKIEVPVDGLDVIAEKHVRIILEKKRKLDQVTLQFPESEFNTGVKFKLQMLDQLTKEVEAVQKTGSGKGIVEAYKYVIESYEDFGTALKNFSPEGKSPEYVSSFQKAMGEVYNPILNNAKKQRLEIKKLVYDNRILSKSNFFVLYSREENEKRYLTLKEVVLMDRGGKK